MAEAEAEAEVKHTSNEWGTSGMKQRGSDVTRGATEIEVTASSAADTADVRRRPAVVAARTSQCTQATVGHGLTYAHDAPAAPPAAGVRFRVPLRCRDSPVRQETVDVDDTDVATMMAQLKSLQQ